MSVRRPRAGEDDLEEMERQFQADRASAAVTRENIVNKRPSAEKCQEGAKKQKSLFSQQREKRKTEAVDPKFQIPEKPSKSGDAERKEEEDNSEQVLLEIVEKNLFGQIDIGPPALPAATQNSKHFPAVWSVADQDKDTEKEDKRSLFSRQFQDMKAELCRVAVEGQDELNLASLGQGSRILQPGGEADSLHQENLLTLGQMTEQEILQEQSKLRQILDPNLLAFIHARQKSAPVAAEFIPMDTKIDSYMDRPADNSSNVTRNEEKSLIREEVTKAEDSVNGETEEKDSVFSLPDLSALPGMTRPEPEKLAWTGELRPATARLAGLSARFGWDGRLVVAGQEVPVTAGLHHHGEEPDRPGYTAEEMLTLARSSSSRQRCLAWQLLEAVLDRWWQGELDPAIEGNLIELLVGAGLVPLLRSALDTTEPGLCVAAARCLAALLYHREEERLLDWVVSPNQPSLAPTPPPEGGPPPAQQSDQDLACRDLVAGLLRMDMLNRLEFLVSHAPPPPLITALLAVLCRLARHSAATAERICRGSLLTSLLSVCWPHHLAVKLVRLLAAWHDLAPPLTAQHGLGTRLTALLAAGEEQGAGQELGVEAVRLWAVLDRAGVAGVATVWEQLSPVLLPRLAALCRVGEDGSQVGAWLALLAPRLPGTRSMLEQCCERWLGQLRHTKVEQLQPNWFQMVGVACSALAEHYSATPPALHSFLSSVLLPVLASPQYRAILSALPATSPHLSGLQLGSRHPACLPGVDPITLYGAPHPALTPASPTLLLTGLVNLLVVLEDPALSPALQPTTPLVETYLSLLLSCPAPALVSHWHSRPAARLAACLLFLYRDTLPASLLHPAALAVAPLLQAPDRSLLQSLFDSFLFSPSLLSARLPALAAAPHSPPPGPAASAPPPVSSVVSSCLARLPALQSVYTSQVPGPGRGRGGCCFPGQDTLLPQDWAYAPLLALYNQGEQRGEVGTGAGETVELCLAWLTLHPPGPSTATFLRLSTIFLCPGSLFLSPTISSLLHHHLTRLLAGDDTGPDLAKPLPGVSSNLDLYLQLLDQFLAESYGCPVFSLYLLVPLAAHQPPAFRRAFWAERPEAARLVGAAGAEPWTVQRWLQPAERQPAVLTAMFRAVAEGAVTRQRNGLLYRVASGQIQQLLDTEDTLEEELASLKTFMTGEICKNPHLRTMFC